MARKRQSKRPPSLAELGEAVRNGPPYGCSLLAKLKNDGRSGAAALYQTCLRRESRARLNLARVEAMRQIEGEITANGFQRVAGVDEAGRGPLAGPIVAAAVVLGGPVFGLDDSKRLTPEQREQAFQALQEGGHGVGCAVIEPGTIDRYGIQTANYMAMAQAVAYLNPPPDFLLVDGFEIKGCALPQKALIKGDQRAASIAAASIVAKVTRDRLMDAFDKRYPGYGFAVHKGYATARHIEALDRLGPCPIHRRSFFPIARTGEEGDLFHMEEWRV